MSGPNYGAQKAAWLFNTYASIVRGATGTAAMGAGLQLAIWEVLYDDGLSLVSGDKFRVTAASSQALDAGSSYLAALAGTGIGYQTARATVLDARRVRRGSDHRDAGPGTRNACADGPGTRRSGRGPAEEVARLNRRARRSVAHRARGSSIGNARSTLDGQMRVHGRAIQRQVGWSAMPPESPGRSDSCSPVSRGASERKGESSSGWTPRMPARSGTKCRRDACAQSPLSTAVWRPWTGYFRNPSMSRCSSRNVTGPLRRVPFTNHVGCPVIPSASACC